MDWPSVASGLIPRDGDTIPRDGIPIPGDAGANCEAARARFIPGDGKGVKARLVTYGKAVPRAWQPYYYTVERDFLSAHQRFTVPTEARSRADHNPNRTHWNDPGNLPGVVLSWIAARKVAAALMGHDRQQIAGELGISAVVLQQALEGRAPFPIEHLAALAERFGPDQVFPTPDEFNEGLKRIDRPADKRRGDAYGPPGTQLLGMLTEADDYGPPTVRPPSNTEEQAAFELEVSAGVLASRWLQDPLEHLEVRAWTRVADDPIPPSRGVRIIYSEDWSTAYAGGEIGAEWPSTIHAHGLASLDGHFVTRVVERGETAGKPVQVEAVWLAPDSNSPDPHPVGRAYLCDVVWDRKGEPTLTPQLDGYTLELFERVSESGDPYRITSLFPGQPRPA